MVKNEMKDCFCKIHNLLKEGKYKDVTEIILNRKNYIINPPYNEDLNHAWYIVGDIYYKQGNNEKAIYAFKKSLEDWPEDIDAMIALSNCYSETGAPDKSEKILNHAVICEPRNPDILYNLANSFFDQSEYEKAIEIYKKIPPKNIELYKLASKNMRRAKKSLKKYNSD